MPRGYHARPGVIRTFIGRMAASAIHSEHNLPGGKLQRQACDGNLRWVRSESESSLTAAFPSPSFSQLPSISREQWTGDGDKESCARVKVSFLPITGAVHQR